MEASTAIRSRLIGAILVEKNLITGEQLERALQLQEDTGERLGEIVVAEFGISRLELAGVLAEQWADLENAERNAVSEPDRPVQHVEPLIPADVQIRRPLGEIFVELGFVSSDQLDAALEAQRETGARIGEILVKQGSLTRLDLASALAEQWSALQKLRPPAPVASPQPWQNGVPVAPPAEQGWSADDRAVVAGLEERLRAVERAAGATPWQEDLRLVTSDLRAAVSAVEARLEVGAPGTAEVELEAALEAVNGRIETLESASVSTDLVALRQELEELKRRPVTVEGLADLGAAVERLEDRPDRADEIASVVARLDQLAARVEDVAATAVPDLSPRIDNLSARVDDVVAAIPAVESDGLAAQIESLEEWSRVGSGALERLEAELGELGSRTQGRLDALASRPPDTALLDGLRSRLDELAARPTEDRALQARMNALDARLEGLGAVEGTIADLRESLDGLDAWRVGDALATGARLAGLEAAVDALAGVETRAPQGVDRTLADRAEALTARLDGAESRLDTVVALEARVAQLAAELEHKPNTEALAGVAAELRAELAELAERPTDADPGERLLELSRRIDRSERDGHERIGGLAEELNLRIAEADHARATGQQELGNRMDEAVTAIRSDLDAREQALAARVTNEVGAVRSELGEQESASAGRLHDAVGAIRVDLDGQVKGLGSQLQAQSNETVALRARIDELLGLRHADVQTARASSERLAERVEALAGLRAADAEAAREAAEDLSVRLESLAESLHAEAAAARAAAEGVAAQIGDLRGQRSGDLAAAELARAELAARLDDHAERSAAAASEVEQALREELGGVAARLEERDAQGIEAREELRGELERAASSVGWRLERIEESLASDDSAELKATVAKLERRLEGQVAMGEEQVRVTERALRKGLASLGERLAGSESAYVDAGNTLRRSIERLGAAVVEADARMADQIPVSEAEGCVAFAPTAAGYRLVELPGKPPEIGSTVELEGCDGPLLVTRYGRSPLPLDSRPCAYLDRA